MLGFHHSRVGLRAGKPHLLLPLAKRPSARESLVLPSAIVMAARPRHPSVLIAEIRRISTGSTRSYSRPPSPPAQRVNSSGDRTHLIPGPQCRVRD